MAAGVELLVGLFPGSKSFYRTLASKGGGLICGVGFFVGTYGIMDVYELPWSFYREIWEAASAEALSCVRETENVSNRYALAVIKNDETVGHVPRKISRFCSLFLTFEEACHHVITKE